MLAALAESHPGTAKLEVIGTSREGRAVAALRITAPGERDPDRRPALLVAANLDGDHLVGSAVALEVGRRLVELIEAGDEKTAGLFSAHTLYVVPRVNPDASERFFAEPRGDRQRNLRPDDRDRDGAVDEDPPNDLDGNGLITMMRVFDPEKADMMPDPQEPRLDVKADRDKGQRPLYYLLTEGADDDNDGQYNEDPVGGVDLNANFMHGYMQHEDGAGPHQVSEPESLALLEFVLAHPNVAAVLVYGRHDNLSKTPDGKGTLPSGAPANIDPKDVALYERVGARFREITGLKSVPAPEFAGSFVGWAYAEFGVPAFATPLWGRPEPPQDEAKEPQQAVPGGEGEGPPPGSGEGLTPSGIGDISRQTIDELRSAAEARGFPVTDEMVARVTPAQVEQFAAQMGITLRRVKEPSAARGGAARDAEEAAWLRYSDSQRQGAGFVPWREILHGQLGRVEVGGWVPSFRTNPPPQEVEPIAAGQVTFVLDLLEKLPRVSIADPQVVRLAEGLYELKLSLLNDGELPTGTAMAVRNRRARPHVVRLGVPDEQVVSGQRVNKVWSVPGSGGRVTFRWIVRAPGGTQIPVEVYSEKYGAFSATVSLSEPRGGEP
jgi:hypothetical protein